MFIVLAISTVFCYTYELFLNLDIWALHRRMLRPAVDESVHNLVRICSPDICLRFPSFVWIYCVYCTLLVQAMVGESTYNSVPHISQWLHK